MIMQRLLSHKLILGFLPIVLLAGCADRSSLAEQKMAEIRHQSAQPIQPPPEPEVVQEFSYSAYQVRSPFMPPSLMVQASQADKVQGVKRDETRLREPLEEFELSQLTYKGTMASTSGEMYGLIQRPDGGVDRVKVGNRMGKNEGRIVEITPTQINLIEIVPDSRVGYVEKPASIVAPAS